MTPDIDDVPHLKNTMIEHFLYSEDELRSKNIFDLLKNYSTLTSRCVMCGKKGVHMFHGMVFCKYDHVMKFMKKFGLIKPVTAEIAGNFCDDD